MEMKPNLFIVGAQKCGTTSVAKLLGSHRKIFFVGGDVFEPEYFANVNRTNKACKSLVDYKKLFSDASPHCRYVGEKSVIYLQLPNAIDAIHNFNPAAKIIVCIRDLVDMIESLDSHLKREGFVDDVFIKHLLEDPDAWRNVAERFQGASLELHADYFGACALGTQVSYLLDVFPKNQVLFLKFEEIVDDPARVLFSLGQFLDLDLCELEIPHENFRAVPKFQFIRKLLKVVLWVKIMLGVHWNTGFLSRVEKINRRKIQSSWSDEIRSAVRNRMSREIEILNSKVGSSYEI